MVRGNKGAAVSNPGSGSQRTDLSAHSQPTRLPSSTDRYGERKRLESLQKGAPMEAQPPAGLRNGVFGRTERPGEPITSGAERGPGPGPPNPTAKVQDPDMMLRALYQLTGHPDIERMLLRRRPVL